MAEIDDLIVKISADVSELVAGMKKATGVTAKAAKGMRDSLNETGGAILKTTAKFAGLAVAAGAAAAAYKTFQGITDAINSADGIKRTADNLGITVEQFSKLDKVVRALGGQTEDLTDSIKDVNERIADAAINGGTYEEALNLIGLRSRELQALRPDEQFKRVADAISNQTDQGRKNFVTAELMADAGFRLLGVMDNLEGGFDKTAEKVAEFSGELTNVEAAQLAEVGRSFNKINLVLEDAFKTIAIDLAPEIKFVTELLFEQSKQVKQVGSVIRTAINFGIKAFNFLRKTILGLKAAFEGVKIALGLITLGIGSMAEIGVRAFDILIKGAKVFGSAINNTFVGIKSFAISKINEMSAEIATTIIDLSKSISKVPFLKDKAKEFEAVGRGIRSASRQWANEAADGAKKASQAFDDNITSLGKALSGETDSVAVAAVRGFNQGIIDEMNASKEKILEIADEAYAIDIDADKLSEKLTEIREINREHVELLTKQDQEQKELADKKEIERHEKLNSTKSRLDAMFTQEELKSIERNKKFRTMSFREQLTVASSFFGSMSQLMETNSRKQFEIGKAAAIAQAGIKTYEAATSAYASLAGIPVVGPALGAAAAAAAVAAGFANVQKIQSTSFGGGSAAGGGGVASASSTPAPAAASGGGGASEDARQQPAQNVTQANISLQGDNFSAQSVRNLISAINEQTDDNVLLSTN